MSQQIITMRRCLFWGSLLLLFCSCDRPPQLQRHGGQVAVLTAHVADAGFPEGDSNYKAVQRASDGWVYYVLSSHDLNRAAQMYRYGPTTGVVEHVADLGAVVGEKGRRVVPQGKVHVNLFELEGKLYLATHIGFYDPGSDAEEPGVVEGYERYQGGHFLSYELKTGKWEDLAKAPVEEGIITMILDADRQRLYGLSWPSGYLLVYDMRTKEMAVHEKTFFYKGEKGSKNTGEWMFICRTFGLDSRNGNLYWSNTKGEVMVFRYATGRIRKTDATLRSMIVGSVAGRDIWRDMIWYEKEHVFYGTHMGSSILFRFDPDADTIQPLERLCPIRNRDGRKEDGCQASLGLELGPDGETIYYVVAGSGITTENGREVRRVLHFLTYHIPSRTYRDHGSVRLEDGRYPVYAQSISFGDGVIYTVAWIEVPAGQRHEQGHEEVNLISFRDPFVEQN